MVELYLGVTSAKRQSADPILALMRKLVRDNLSREETLLAFWEAIENDKDMLKRAVFYGANNLYTRCTNQKAKKQAQKESKETEEHIYNTIEKDQIINWWDFIMPTTGKKLCNSTFAEVKEGGRISGKFLARLSLCGAPGTMVREVFPNRKTLQDFFFKDQKQFT